MSLFYGIFIKVIPLTGYSIDWMSYLERLAFTAGILEVIYLNSAMLLLRVMSVKNNLSHSQKRIIRHLLFYIMMSFLLVWTPGRIGSTSASRNSNGSRLNVAFYVVDFWNNYGETERGLFSPDFWKKRAVMFQVYASKSKNVKKKVHFSTKESQLTVGVITPYLIYYKP